MNNQLPVIVNYRVNGITLEVCHGKIPHIYHILKFGPIVEPELPDTKVTDEEFQDWLFLYRRAGPVAERQLLEEAQCS